MIQGLVFLRENLLIFHQKISLGLDLDLCGSDISRLDSVQFQNLSFQPKLDLFRENDKNDNEDEFPDFNKFTQYMIFAILLELAIFEITVFC